MQMEVPRVNPPAENYVFADLFLEYFDFRKSQGETITASASIARPLGETVQYEVTHLMVNADF